MFSSISQVVNVCRIYMELLMQPAGEPIRALELIQTGSRSRRGQMIDFTSFLCTNKQQEGLDLLAGEAPPSISTCRSFFNSVSKKPGVNTFARFVRWQCSFTYYNSFIRRLYFSFSFHSHTKYVNRTLSFHLNSSKES